MQRLLTVAAAGWIGAAAMAFAQGLATDRVPARGETQPSANPATARASNRGTASSREQIPVGRTPATPNQALPGDANPANAATRDGRSNGQGLQPDTSQGGPQGTAAGNPSANRGSKVVPRDDSGTSQGPARDPDNVIHGGTTGSVQWFWLTLGIIVGVILIGLLFRREEAVADIKKTDTVRARRYHDDIGDRDDDLRKAG